MTAGLARPSRLSSGVIAATTSSSPATRPTGPCPRWAAGRRRAGVLHIERRRFLWDRRMFERVRMVNHGVEDVLLPLAFDFGADFADIFQVRGTLREQARHAAHADPRRPPRDLPLRRPGRRRAHQLPVLLRAARRA